MNRVTFESTFWSGFRHLMSGKDGSMSTVWYVLVKAIFVSATTQQVASARATNLLTMAFSWHRVANADLSRFRCGCRASADSRTWRAWREQHARASRAIDFRGRSA